MIDPAFDHYARAIIDAWRSLPCTRGQPTRTDRTLLRELYRAGIALPLILAAFRLGSHRRSPRLPPVRSIAYFLPVLHELSEADPAYLDYLNSHSLTPSR